MNRWHPNQFAHFNRPHEEAKREAKRLEEKDRRPLADVLAELVAERKSLKQKTRDTYEEHLARFETWTDLHTAFELMNADPKKLNQQLATALKKAKPGTVRGALTLARMLARRLQEEGFVRNPLVRLDRLPKPEPLDWNVLNPGELERCLEHLEKSKRFGAHAVFSLLGFHGLRVSEMCGLTIGGNVFQESDGRVAIVFKGKGDKTARIRLRPSVVESVKRWRAKLEFTEKDEGPFVPMNKRGTTFKRNTVHRLVRDVTQEVVGHAVTPHGLRATYISSAASRKKNLDDVRQLARHSTLAQTATYLRWKVLDDDGDTE